MIQIMDSIGISFGFDFNQRFDTTFDFNNVVKNDVFLSQTNALFEDYFCFENFTENTIFNDSRSDKLMDESSGVEKEWFEEFWDDLCAKEKMDSMANHSLLGCICCNSCKLKSEEFVSKTNDMFDQFRHQLFELKDSVRQQLNDINSQLNQTRLKFAKLLLDLQIKLNEKNNQLEKTLDLSQLLKQTNDLLLNNTQQNSIKFENICKENIEYKKRLGIEAKVLLNAFECEEYLKEMKKKKSIMSSNIDNVINNVIKNELINKNGLNIGLKTESTPQLPKPPNCSKSPPKSKSPKKQNVFLKSKSVKNSKIETKLKNKSIDESSQSLKELSYFNNFHKNNNKINNNIKNNIKTNNNNNSFKEQEIKLKYEQIFKKYNISSNNEKKRRSSDRSSPQKNHTIDDISQESIAGRLAQRTNDNKKFCENKELNK